MALYIQLEERGLFPFTTKTIQNQIYKAVHFEIGKAWHERFKPLHFGNSASTRYGYSPRSGERGNMPAIGFKQSYTGRKLNNPYIGHSRPLEYTGQSRELAMASKTIYATKNGVKVVINAPAFNYRNPYSKVDMRAEMTRVLPEENAELAKLAQEEFMKLGQLIPLEKVRIG